MINIYFTDQKRRRDRKIKELSNGSKRQWGKKASLSNPSHNLHRLLKNKWSNIDLQGFPRGTNSLIGDQPIILIVEPNPRLKPVKRAPCAPVIDEDVTSKDGRIDIVVVGITEWITAKVRPHEARLPQIDGSPVGITYNPRFAPPVAIPGRVIVDVGGPIGIAVTM